MQRTPVSGLDDDQVRIAPPSGARSLDHVMVSNPSDAVAYLNFWVDSATEGSPALAIADVADQVAIPAGAAQPVLMELPILAAGSLVISASTDPDGTGTPSAELQMSIRWGAVAR